MRHDPDHDPYQFEYDPQGLMTLQIDPRGSRHVYQHDTLGRITGDLDPANGSQTFAVSNGPGLLTVTKTTALGQVTRYEWRNSKDGTSRYTITLPTGRANQRQLAVDGSATTTMVDGTTARVVHSPDAVFGMFAPVTSHTVTAPNGLTHTVSMTRATSLAGDGTGTLTETVNDNGRVATHSYAGGTRTWTTTSTEGRVRCSGLDSLARVVSTDAPGALPRSVRYDARGRVDRFEQGVSRFRTLAYDATSGYLQSTTDALSLSTQYSSDAFGRVTNMTAPDASVTSFSYDGEGHITAVTPPGRPVHQLAYSPVDLLQDYTAPALDSATTNIHTEYDRDRRLIAITQPDGQRHTFTYHPTTGQLTTRTIPGAGTSTFAYDTRDRVSSVTLPAAGAVTYGYSGALVTSKSVSGPHSVSDGATLVWSGNLSGSVLLGYDNAFQLNSVDVRGATGAPNGFAVQYARDRDDLLTSVAPLVTGTSVPTLTLSRSTLDGRLTATTFGSVTTSLDNDLSTSTPGYGETTARTAKINGSDILRQQYQRDVLGRIQRIDETIQGSTNTRQFEYDAAGRLTRVRDAAGVLVSEYDYDGNGARTRVRTVTQQLDLGVTLGCGADLSQAVDLQDRLCRYGDYTYAYNANGQLASKSQVTTGATTQYTYDGSGLLRRVATATRRIDYAYDALGRRIGKIVDGALRKGWLYQDALRPVAQLNTSGQIESTFVYATQVNVPEYMVMRVTGQVYRFVTDSLGSVRLVINVADGSVVQRIDYDEFGRVLTDTNPGFQPFGFAGGLYDADTGLVRFGARDYDAVTGRWTAKDPLLFGGHDTNLYAYVGNDPINFIDPMGWMKLPPNPSGLGSDWVFDPSHRHGERYRHPSGDYLDFHPGDPSRKTGKRNLAGSKDHWHHNGEDKHLFPGDEIDDPESICQESRSITNPADTWFESTYDPTYGGDGTVPFFPLPFFGPLPNIPFPAPSPLPLPAF